MIERANALQAAAYRAQSVPDTVQIVAGVHAIALPMQSPLGYSLCYAIDLRSGGLMLIDTGVDSDENWARLNRELEHLRRSVSAIEWIVLSHLHHDHVGLVSRIVRATGATVALHADDADAIERGTTYFPVAEIDDRIDGWGAPRELVPELREWASRTVFRAPPFAVDMRTVDGDVIGGADDGLRVVHTPGHTRGHQCVVAEDHELVFTGDHVLPMLNPGIGLGGFAQRTDPMADYFASLERAGSMESAMYCPGHGFVASDLGNRCAAIGSHHRSRREEIRGIAAADPSAKVWSVASRARWSAGWSSLSGPNRFFALMQTEMHLS